MKQLIVLMVSLLMCTMSLKAQMKNSLSIGGGINRPISTYAFKWGWNADLHWNIGVSRSVFIDPHIGVEDTYVSRHYSGKYRISKLGLGLKYYFTSRFSARAGALAMILNDGSSDLYGEISGTFGLGYDIPITSRHGLELSLNNDLVRDFVNKGTTALPGLGLAYKFWYGKR